MRAFPNVLICCVTATILITGCTSTTKSSRDARIPGLLPNAPTYTHMISISQDQLVSFKGQTLDMATLDQVLSKEGVNSLSLRRVARKAGVSHAAPYAHFADKQALVAAIATDGYRKIYEKIVRGAEQYPDDPLRQLVETAWAYVEFGFQEPDHFRITF